MAIDAKVPIHRQRFAAGGICEGLAMRNPFLSQTNMTSKTKFQLVGSGIARTVCRVLGLDLATEKRHSEDHAPMYIAQMHPFSAGVPP